MSRRNAPTFRAKFLIFESPSVLKTQRYETHVSGARTPENGRLRCYQQSPSNWRSCWLVILILTFILSSAAIQSVVAEPSSTWFPQTWIPQPQPGLPCRGYLYMVPDSNGRQRLGLYPGDPRKFYGHWERPTPHLPAYWNYGRATGALSWTVREDGNIEFGKVEIGQLSKGRGHSERLYQMFGELIPESAELIYSEWAEDNLNAFKNLKEGNCWDKATRTWIPGDAPKDPLDAGKGVPDAKCMSRIGFDLDYVSDDGKEVRYRRRRGPTGLARRTDVLGTPPIPQGPADLPLEPVVGPKGKGPSAGFGRFGGQFANAGAGFVGGFVGEIASQNGYGGVATVGGLGLSAYGGYLAGGPRGGAANLISAGVAIGVEHGAYQMGANETQAAALGRLSGLGIAAGTGGGLVGVTTYAVSTAASDIGSISGSWAIATSNGMSTGQFAYETVTNIPHYWGQMFGF